MIISKIFRSKSQNYYFYGHNNEIKIMKIKWVNNVVHNVYKKIENIVYRDYKNIE